VILKYPKRRQWPYNAMKKIILGAGILILVAAGIAAFRTMNPATEIGTYTLEKAGFKFILTNGGESIYAESALDLGPYIGKQVRVEGIRKTRKEKVQCIPTPCDPVEITYFEIQKVSSE
jgi:hypothetical protein